MPDVTTVSAVITAEAGSAVTSLDEVTGELKLTATAVKALSTSLKNMGLGRMAKEFADTAKNVSLSQNLKATQTRIEKLAQAAEKAGDKVTAAFLRENANPLASEREAAAAEEAAQAQKEALKAAEEEQKRYLKLVREIGKAEKKERVEAAKAAAQAAKEAEKAANVAADSERAHREIVNNAIIADARRRETEIAKAAKQAEDQQRIGAQALAKAQAEAARAAVRAKNYDNAQKAKEEAKALKEAAAAAKLNAKNMQEAKKALGGLGDAFSAPIKKIQQFIKAIGRIALYRAIRTAIKNISAAVKEGLTNLYTYSQTVGTAFAPAVDTLRQHVLRLKNAFATALRPVIEALIPIIQRLVDWLAKAADFVAQVFSVLTGKVDEKGRYTKAVLSDLKQSNKQAKELRRTLLGFDEINRLDGQTNSGESNNAGLMFTQAEVSPEAVAAAEKIQKILNKIREIIAAIDWDVVLKVLAALAILKVGLNIAKKLKAVFDILKGIASILGGTGGIIALVALAIAAFALWGDKIGAALDKARVKIRAFFKKIKGYVSGSGILSAVVTLIGDAIDVVADFVASVARMIYKGVRGDFKGASDEAFNILKTILKAAATVVLGALNIILGIIQDVLNVALSGVRWLWNNALVPLINWIVTGLYKIEVAYQNGIINLKINFQYLAKWLLDKLNSWILEPLTEKINSAITRINQLLGSNIQPVDLTVDTTRFDDKIEELKAMKLPPITETVKVVGEWKEPAKLNLQIDTTGALSAIDKIGQKVNKLGTAVSSVMGAIGGQATQSKALVKYASGGFPSVGTVFVAGERGAEYVATINGQTGVYNTDQMAAAMYKAVAAALANMPQQGGDIYLDGEVIYKSVVRRNNNHVRSTGRAALLT